MIMIIVIIIGFHQKKNYYNDNRDLILDRHRNYYSENRDLILDKQRNYYSEKLDNKNINRQVEYQNIIFSN